VGLAEIEVYDTVMYQGEAVINSKWNGFQIFPNPTSGGVITLAGLPAGEPHHIQIFNLFGEVTSELLVEGSPIRLAVSDLRPGVYFVRVINRLSEQVRKLIIH